MRKLSIVHAVGLALVLVSCSRGSQGDAESPVAELRAGVAEAPAAAPPVVADQAVATEETHAGAAVSASRLAANPGRTRGLTFGAPPPATDASGAMLVRSGEASLEVRNVDDALARARQTATQFGGFVANTAIRNGKDEQRSASLEIRVPTGQFDALLAALGGLGKVESVTASAQDVGEEYVDLGARATNARRMEARLLEMLASRTGKLSELLTVEQELTRVREEIERYDARLRWLERRSALSALTLTLHEPLGLIERPRKGPLVDAVAIAWERTLGVIAWCIASLGLIVPLGVLIGIGVVIARRVPALAVLRSGRD